MPRGGGPWTALGFRTRAEYRAAQRASGERHYPLEAQQRKAREGTGYGHGGDKFVNQFRDKDTVIVIFKNIKIRGWKYQKGKGWMKSRTATPSRVAVVVDSEYAYETLKATPGGLHAYAAELLNSSFGHNFTAGDIVSVGDTEVNEIQ